MQETGLRRLEAAIARQTVQDWWGIGDTAWQALTLKLERLAAASRSQFRVERDEQRDGYGKTCMSESMTEATYSPGDSLTLSARQVAAVFSPEGEDPALWMHRNLGNRNMTLKHWREVIQGRSNQPDVSVLRSIARLIREGHDAKTAGAMLGESERQYGPVGQLLGAAEWRRDREVRFATECMEAGMTQAESYRQWCAMVPETMQVARKTWDARCAEAREVLGVRA